MPNTKRSRTAGKVLPLDVGKKNRTAPSKPTPPPPSPLIHCLKVKVVIMGDWGVSQPTWVEVANYPAEGGLEAFYDLIHRTPDDSFMTADAGASISFAAVVAIRRPRDSDGEFQVKVEASPPGAPKRLYQRLHVPIGLGHDEVVEVANVPWTENGIAHFARVIGKHRSCDIVTTDSGFMPVRNIKLEDLRMPGDTTEPRHKRLRPEDILRPEDLPE